MRIVSMMTMAGIAVMAMGQQPNPIQETFTSAADVEAMIAKAKEGEEAGSG